MCFGGIIIFIHYCPVNNSGSLAALEMTRNTGTLEGGGVGGGEIATDPSSICLTTCHFERSEKSIFNKFEFIYFTGQ